MVSIKGNKKQDGKKNYPGRNKDQNKFKSYGGTKALKEAIMCVIDTVIILEIARTTSPK